MRRLKTWIQSRAPGRGVLVICGLLTLIPALAQDGPPEGRDDDRAEQEQREDASRERLIRKMLDGEEDDVMRRIVGGMDQAQRRLDTDMDIGDATQRIQQQILDDLDEAIDQARRNMQVSNASPSPSGDDRPGGQPAEQDMTGASGSDSAQDLGPGGVADDIEIPANGLLQDMRRQWGNLPPRAREEILQGLQEGVHEAFREQILKYYEALSKQPDADD